MIFFVFLFFCNLYKKGTFEKEISPILIFDIKQYGQKVRRTKSMSDAVKKHVPVHQLLSLLPMLDHQYNYKPIKDPPKFHAIIRNNLR